MLVGFCGKKMSESGKVRIVRCPKCDNLLPEVSNFSVYQCGGCGAVLKAKNKGVDLDTFSEKSDEGRVGESIEKLSDRYEKMNLSEKKMTELSDGSESDVRSNISSTNRAEKRILSDRRENYSPSLMNQHGKTILESDEIQHKVFLQAKVSQDFEDPTTWNGSESLKNSGRLLHGRNGARRTKEDPSNLLPKSGYDYGNPMMTRDGTDGFNDFDYVGDDRVELLRQLDELKEKLSRSGNLMPDGKETVGMNRRMPYQDPYASDSSSRYSYPNAQFQRHTYHNQYTEPPSLIDREEMGRTGFYPPQQHNPSNIRRYEDPSRSHMPNRREDLPSRVYNSGPYVDDGSMYMASMDPYPPKPGRHHPSCSCYECYNKRLVTTSTQPTSYNDNISRDTMFNYNASSFGSLDYNHGIPDPRLRSRNSHLHNRWPSDVNSEAGSFPRRPPLRARLASNGRHCRPMAGGAPFLTCRNCFEVLLLPKRISTNRKKMRCSACSTVIVCEVLNDSLVFSIDVEAKDTDDAYNLKQGTTSFSFDHYDNSGYDFKSMDRDSRNVSNEGRNFNSTSNYTSEAEEDWKHSDSADVATKEKRYHMVGRSGEGNRSGRSEDDKEFVNKTITNRQISRNESSATEIDLSSNEYGNTGSTFDSGERSRGDHQSKGRRVADSFFAGILKKSSKDLSKNGLNSVEEEKANVTVNGHLIPDRLIKKAEKLAGPIHPGNYWYDFRAGFWGAVGGPCLGIVPPFIEEFNYPMPEQCGGGNTHVFVNGRELNQKDLNLLASRGLPSESNRSYIVEISGRVLDEDTSEELEGLGKLAPTVEKAKRGFGMRDPNAVPR